MKKSGILKISLPIALLLCGGAIIWFSAVCKKGISAGLSICAEAIIPSLFPFLCFSNFLAAISDRIFVPKLFAKLHYKIFGLPELTFLPVLFSLIGGYPVGACMADELYSKGKISKSEAQLMMLFCCNSGPAFGIVAIGVSLLNSRLTGIFIFISTTLAALTAGMLIAPFHKTPQVRKANELYKSDVSISDALVASIEKSTYSMLKICAWIIIFSMIYALFEQLKLPEYANKIAAGIFEVTVGSKVNAPDCIAISAIMGFGGISVHFQIKEHLINAGVPSYKYFLSRLLVAALSAFYMYAFVTFFPEAKPVFADSVTVIPTYAGYPFAAALLFSLAVFIMGERKRA